MPESQRRGEALDEIKTCLWSAEKARTIVEFDGARSALETLLARYNRGTQLSQLCQAKLNEGRFEFNNWKKDSREA